MNEVKIIGRRQTGRTTILLDIAKRSIDSGLLVVFVTKDNHHKEIIRRIIEQFDKIYHNIIVKSANDIIKGLHVNILLLDNRETMEETHLSKCILPSIIKTNGMIYSTYLK